MILAAAKVGGIKVNNEKRGEFIFNNLAIQNNVIDASLKKWGEKFNFSWVKLCLS